MFNIFPYTDFHEINLDWIIRKIKELGQAFNDFEAVNKITNAGAWDITKQYRAWTVVSDNNIGYISLKPVPIGVAITNTEYWGVIADYDILITDLSNRISTLETRVDDLGTSTTVIKTFEDYGAVGDGVADDTDSIKAALQDAADKNYKLTSLHGTYLISDDLVVDGITLEEFGTIKADSSNKITIHQHSIVKYGAFEKINIVANGYYVDLSNVSINDYDGIGLSISNISTTTTYDRHGQVAFEHIRCNNMSKDGALNIGFNIACPDVYLDYCESINNGIGYRIKSQCCHIAHATAWLNGNTTLAGSKAYRIEASAFELLSCTSDTMQTSISLISQYLYGSVTDFSFLVNNTHFQNSTFLFMDTFGGIVGNAILKMSGMSAAGNVLNIGSAGHMRIDIFDGSVSDHPLMFSGNTIFTPNGFTCSFSGNCKEWREPDIYHLKLQFEVTSASFVIGASHTINAAYKLPDYKGMTITNYPIDCIYHAPGEPYVAGKALLSIDSAGVITITPYFYKSTCDYLLMVNADIEVPVPSAYIAP